VPRAWIATPPAAARDDGATVTDPIEVCLAGKLAPNLAIARAILSGVAIDDVFTRIADRGDAAAVELRRLLSDPVRLERVRAMAVVAGIDHRPDHAATVSSLQTAFDNAVAAFPEASVAAYTLGDPDTLRAATDEIIRWLNDRVLLQPGYDVLDLGCGIGRVAGALAPHVRTVLGLDISPFMIAEARRRYNSWASVGFHVTDGQGLVLPHQSRDLVVAVDSFPYLVQAGVADRHIGDAVHVLRPGGFLAIFNLSYRGVAADRADADRWSRAFGYQLLCAGETPFTVWDASVFLMRRAAD